jgi:SAM-dependent methyltransferase
MSDLEFTGERFIQGQGGVQMAYEHLHRYYYAARWSAGKTVLDVAAGSGYGSAILAQSALNVCAVDMDRSSLLHARNTCGADNVGFMQADATRLPFRSQSFEYVVAFEILEHVAEQEILMGELARVARPRAPVLISTPNRASYSDARGYANPFHVHEFYREEFLQLLNSHFGYVHLLRQQVRAGSYIDGETPLKGDQIIASPAGAGIQAAVEPMYFLALCSVQAPCDAEPIASAYLDIADSLFMETRDQWGKTNAEIARLNEEIHRLGRWASEMQEKLAEKEAALRQAVTARETDVAARDQAIRELQDELRRELELRDRALAELHREFDERSSWALQLRQDVEARDQALRSAIEKLDATDAELRRVGDHLATIRHAFLYRVLCRLGVLPK